MELYHVLNRGVDKRIIFEDTQDYARFIHDMYEFNSKRPAKNTYRSSMCDFVSRTLTREQHDNERIVDVHGWCLMGNHYHLLLSERVEGGITIFLRKLNIGYAKYFNEKNDRSGALFQGRTRRICIEEDAHFLHILNYIHFNPLDFHNGSQEWRSGRITSSKEALSFLTQYKWSSYQDYIGVRNFPSILSKTLFGEVFNNRYANSVEQYLQDLVLHDINNIIIE